VASAEQKVLQYLNEAHASEQALTRVLESQIAIAPRGSLRDGLVTHLQETKDHAIRVAERLGELGQGSKPLMAAFGLAETVIGQVLALGKTPIDLVRGTSGAEKVLKNAKDACATEGLEIATYTAIERLAQAAGDRKTAQLAASIRSEEEAMLERLLEEIPKLTRSVVDGSYNIADTGAGEAVREAGRATRSAARSTRQPWAGYDELTVSEIKAVLDDADAALVQRTRAYENAHKARAGVLQATESELSNA
jgi:ferritin-like metal-binding protein YciE